MFEAPRAPGRVALAACLLLAAAGCRSRDGDAPTDAAEVAAIPVAVMPVRRGTVRIVERYAAEIRPSAQVNVLPKIADRIVRIGFEEGDQVVAGETVLAELATDLVDTGVRQAESGVRAVSAQIAGLRTQQTRLRQLVADGVVSASQLDPVDAQIKVLQAQRSQMLSGVDMANLRKDDAIVRATMTGYVSKRFVEAGDMASPMTPICTIVRLDPVFAWLDVPEHDLEDVRGRSTATLRVEAAPGRAFAATLDLISPSVDRESRTVRIRYRADNPDTVLRDGMLATAEIELVRHEGVVVPFRAVVMDPAQDGNETGYHVFVADGSTARRVEVRAGIVEGDWIEVTNGLQVGDRLIVDGFHLVSDGAAIDVVSEAEGR